MEVSNDGIMDRVKRSFLRMTSSTEFGASDNKHIPPVLSVNAVWHLAFAEACYSKISRMLQTDILNKTQESERFLLLNDCLFSIEQAINALNEADYAFQTRKNKPDLKFFSDYLNIIATVLRLLVHLVKGQSDALHALDSSLKTNSFLLDVFQKEDALFGDTELSLLHFLRETMKKKDDDFRKICKQFTKNMTKNELLCYKQATEFFKKEKA